MADGHAKLAPSASSRWMQCTQSQRLIEEHNLESKGSKAAMEGTVAHALAEVLTEDNSYTFIGRSAKDALNIDSNILISSEMVRHISAYNNYVREHVRENSMVFTEISAPLFYDTESKGTSDKAIITGRHCDIIDLKYGKYVVVDAEENSQLIIYAISVIDYVEEFLDEEINTIGLHIFQPRADNYPRYDMTRAQLINWRAKVLEAIDEIENRPKYSVGEKQCRFCPAKAICPARAGQNMKIVSEEFKILDEEPKKPLTIDQMASIVAQGDEIRAWLKDMYNHLFEAAHNGTKVPNFHLKWGSQTRKWKDEEEAKKFLLQHFKLDDIINETLITAPGSDRLVKGKKEIKEEVEALITKTEAKLTLVKGEGENACVNLFNDLGDNKL